MDWLAYFKKWASRYEMEVEAYGYEPKKLIKPFIALIGKRKRCLDVGCGTGKSLEAVKNFCDEVVGVEPVEKMARRAEARGFRVLRLRGEELGKIGGRFDFISFFASIDYMRAERVAEEVKEVVENSGLVFLTVEPENEKRVVEAFSRNGFKVVKRVEKKAYEGQRYVCMLLRAESHGFP